MAFTTTKEIVWISKLLSWSISSITEHKESEERIREQVAFLDKVCGVVIVLDLEHRIIYWNKYAEQLYGWKQEETIDRNVNELLCKDKSSQPINAKKSISEKGDWSGELHQVTKAGRDVIVESRWILVRDDGEKPISILVVNTDITEKKKLESHLLRAQRMESIGMLAGGIVHDLNNVLAPVMLSIQMLKEKFTDEQSQKLLTILERNSQRGANLIKRVMSFGQEVGGERKPFQITYIISEIEKIAKETFPRNIKILTNVSKDLWTFYGNDIQLYQVLMNLCLNARDAMPRGGFLRISAENILIDNSYAQMNTEAKVGPYIIITFSDTGTGIPPKILDRIFEPFFTTKEHGRGTGLGLSIALEIVKSHGGFIDVHSEAGEGTVFKVYLPATKAETQKEQEQRIELPAGHGESVFVVDEDIPKPKKDCRKIRIYGI